MVLELIELNRIVGLTLEIVELSLQEVLVGRKDQSLSQLLHAFVPPLNFLKSLSRSLNKNESNLLVLFIRLLIIFSLLVILLQSLQVFNLPPQLYIPRELLKSLKYFIF